MSCSSAKSAGWADLPSEIVVSIAKRLVVAEVVRLRAVCSCWAWALGKSSGLRQKGLYSPSPWILLPNSSLEDVDFCTFFSITEDRFYRVPSLKQITDRRYILLSSSQHGWLVSIDNVLAPYFFNPLTRQILHLPTLLTIPRSRCSNLYFALGASTNKRMFYEQYLRKIILISTPLEERIAVAFCRTHYHGICLLFARVEDDVWSIGPSLPLDLNCSLDDIKYNEGDDKLYVLTSSGDVFVLQFKNHTLEIVSMVCRPIGYEHYRMFEGYISFSHGDLLLVNKYSKSYPSYNNTFNDTTFKIFRLDRASCWAPVDGLGNQALFIGPNNCFALHDVEEHKKNKIFFIHHVPTTRLLNANKIRYSIQKFGVFDLETNKVEYVLPFELHAQYFPILFFPEPKLWD
ncbi:hypothetical protein KSP39_PZI006296 [Platanthera zijinensis]|uniref:KIB1-4 beta-propeller domain-containing protein n=1 Tax=Platanthera zijinensis TaxID=2320716 RepID=A0AAP0BSB9_9ASPA